MGILIGEFVKILFNLLVTLTRTRSGSNRCVFVVALVHVTLVVNVDMADLSVVDLPQDFLG